MPTLSELFLYPIKSCGGIRLDAATLSAAGLSVGAIHDRAWMLVDDAGQFLTQRAHPRMALIRPRIENDRLRVSAPDMPDVVLPAASEDLAERRAVRIWRDTLTAEDAGEPFAAWFTQALGTPCRLVRFPEGTQRLSDRAWTGAIDAPNRFSDGFPFLVIAQESLDDLNARLREAGRDALPMNRFRPNLVIRADHAFEEDHAAEIRIGQAVFQPVKPCPRCPMPSIDQDTGRFGPDPLDILRRYRVSERVDGGIVFGMNAVLTAGVGSVVRVGTPIDITLAFD